VLSIIVHRRAGWLQWCVRSEHFQLRSGLVRNSGFPHQFRSIDVVADCCCDPPL